MLIFSVAKRKEEKIVVQRERSGIGKHIRNESGTALCILRLLMSTFFHSISFDLEEGKKEDGTRVIGSGLKGFRNLFHSLSH